jgi:trans-aconitate methyltransferase
VAKTWDAGLYEARHGFVWKYGAELLELLVPLPGERILDLGCGTGQLTAQIAAAGAEVVGVDLSAEMIAAARRNYPQLHFENGDARSLSWHKEFDGVLSNAVLHWVLEADQAAASVARTLKPGGRFVAEFGGKGNVAAVLAAVEQGYTRVTGEPPAVASYFPSIAEYAAVLETAGLETTCATLFDRPTPLEGADGLRQWIAMFRGQLLERVPPERREEFFRIVEDAARPQLFQGGIWHADYRRLRIVARRPRAA